jgi:hypothetical protein
VPLKVVLTFDEMKPHWATKAGLDKSAERLGMKVELVGGDPDAKIAKIFGTVDDFDAFEKAIILDMGLRWGTLSRVAE